MRRVLGAVRLEWLALVGAGVVVLLVAVWFRPQPTHEPALPTVRNRAAATSATQEAEAIPGRPAGSQWDGEITLYSDKVPAAEAGMETTVWVYLPGEKRPAASLPVVFIAPDGTNGLIGAALDESNQAEHLPWVRAGFAVVAYSLAGAPGENESDEQTMLAAKAFREARGGMDNTQAAITYTLSRFPEMDPKRFYVAGHGSAGTLALNLAGHDERIAGCVAFGPILKVGEYSSRGIMTVLEQLLPGTKAFAESISPGVVAEKITCPVLIVHAEDDTKVPTADVEAFAEAVKKTNRHVILEQRAKSPESDSEMQAMIETGVKWLKELGTKP